MFVMLCKITPDTHSFGFINSLEGASPMRYTRFEDLPVGNSAIELAVAVYTLTDSIQFRRRRSLRDQIERAAVSVSNNIAEGFERGTTQELLTFFYIARGSAGEVRSMLSLFERLGAFANLKFEISNLKSKAESISRQLRGWANSLQNSDIRASGTYRNGRAAKLKPRKSEKSF